MIPWIFQCTHGEMLMKPILYTGAMDAETLYLMQELKQPERVTLGCWKRMRGTLDDIPVVIVRRLGNGKCCRCNSACH